MSAFTSARTICVFLLIAVPALVAAETPAMVTPASLKTVHRVHSLAEFGDDPHIGLWLAKTIGEVIAPGTWDTDAPGGEKRVLRYYAPGKILVVAHTAAVQAEIEAFLKSVKQSLPVARPMAPPPILRAQNLVPALPTELPAIDIAAKPPRHVFHMSVDGYESKMSDSGEGSETKFRNFTLRYEGEGLFDLAELARNVNVKTGNEAPPPIPMVELPPAPKNDEPDKTPAESETPKPSSLPPKIEHSETPPETLPPIAPEEELLPMPKRESEESVACGVILPGGPRSSAPKTDTAPGDNSETLPYADYLTYPPLPIPAAPSYEELLPPPQRVPSTPR